MGPAVLVTLGLLFLMANTSNYPFERTWPILLIVIGAIKVVRYVISDEGHFNPGQYPLPPYPPGGDVAGGVPYAAPPASGPVMTPATVPAISSDTLSTTMPAPKAEAGVEANGESGEVRNG
jgi:hypothetical protein